MEVNKAFEYYIGKRKNNGFDPVKIELASDVNKFARQFYHEDLGIYESFFIMLLDRRNVVTGWAKISQGGVAGTVVDLKIVLKYAIDCLASGVIFVHNHPSGNLDPSQADINLTNKAKEALKLLDINLLDHLIISDTTNQSFKSIINE
jgi:DNA repair protein RadC